MRAPRHLPSLAWLPIGLLGWTAVAVMGLGLGDRAGDDLRLLVTAGARWASGLPLYVQPSGTLDATTLFYSYPPIVAQALAPVSGLPFAAILVAWGLGAALGLAAVTRRLAPALVLPVLALAPYALPYAISLLFGNVNAWFPVVTGLLLAALLRPGRGAALAAGVALALAAAAKLHPASIGLFLAVRAVREGRHSASWRPVAVAVATGTALLAVSLVVGGPGPWADWLGFLAGGSATADLVSRLNIGPASQVALVFGLDDTAARSLQVLVTAAALATAVLAGWRLSDPVEGMAWATVASLVVLPVTWYHYPAALIAVAVAAAGRRHGSHAPVRVVALGGAAVAVSAAAIVLPVTAWVAVGLVLAMARESRPAHTGEQVVAGRAAMPSGRARASVP